MSGEEIMANVKENFNASGTIESYTLSDPCVLVPSQEGKLLFVKWVPYANTKNGITIKNNTNIVFVLDPLKELEDHFTSVVTNNLFVPTQSKKIVTPGELQLSQ